MPLNTALLACSLPGVVHWWWGDAHSFFPSLQEACPPPQVLRRYGDAPESFPIIPQQTNPFTPVILYSLPVIPPWSLAELDSTLDPSPLVVNCRLTTTSPLASPLNTSGTASGGESCQSSLNSSVEVVSNEAGSPWFHPFPSSNSPRYFPPLSPTLSTSMAWASQERPPHPTALIHQTRSSPIPIPLDRAAPIYPSPPPLSSPPLHSSHPPLTYLDPLLGPAINPRYMGSGHHSRSTSQSSDEGPPALEDIPSTVPQFPSDATTVQFARPSLDDYGELSLPGCMIRFLTYYHYCLPFLWYQSCLC